MKKMMFGTIVLLWMLDGCSVLSMNNPFDDVKPVVTTTTISYTIVFDANGGGGQMSAVNAVNDETIDIPDCALNPPVGKRFACWNTAADGSGMTYYPQSVRNLAARNGTIVTLYAQWMDKDAHRIIYRNIDGVNNLANPISFYESENVAFVSVSKIGYGFIGWYDISDDSPITGWNVGDKVCDVTLTAKWDTFRYAVTFHANGGIGEIEQIDIQYDETVDVPICTIVPPVGTKFGSWNTKSDGTGVRYYEGDEIHNLTNIHNEVIPFYAQWIEKDMHRIIYRNIKNADNAINPVSFRESQNITLNDISETGYLFLGWYEVKNDVTSDVSTDGWTVGELTDDIMLYAQWSPIRYRVVFDNNGGSGVQGKVTISYDETADVPPCDLGSPVGKQFICWNTKADGTGMRFYQGDKFFNLTNIHDEVITFYAQWAEKDNHHITYLNIRSTDNADNPVLFLESQNVVLSDILDDGYIFLGWYEVQNDVTSDVSTDGWTAGELTDDITLWAKWTPIQYRIVFDNNGGSGYMNSDVVLYDETVDVPECAYTAPAGYHFDSWNTALDGSGIRFIPGQNVSALAVNDGETVILYAQWFDNSTHRINYLFDGLDGVFVETYSYLDGYFSNPLRFNESNDIVLSDLSDDLCIFAGWLCACEKSSYYRKIISGWNAGEMTDDVSLIGVGYPVLYPVKFDPNGGTGSMDNQLINYYGTGNQTTALKPNSFTRSGYTFCGWAASPTGDVLYSDKEKVPNLVKWSDIINTVYTEDRDEFKLSVGSDFIPMMARSVEFLENAQIITSRLDGMVTLYAVWRPSTYTVSFNANGGTGTMSDQNMTCGTAAALAANSFTKDGYTFAGWATSTTGAKAYNDKQSVTDLTTVADSTVTLYAVWQPNTYNVVFNANGGTGTMSSESMTYDTAAALTANAFTRTGYTFGGWATSASGAKVYDNKQSVTSLTAVSGGSVTLYAVWTANTYSIAFGKNNGTGTMSNLSMTYNVSKALTANSFTRTGYTFDHWNTKTNGSGTNYTAGQTVINLTATNNGSVTIYAIWKPNTYTVKFNANGGVGVMPDQIMTYGTAEPLQNVSCIRKGWTFLGWSTSSTATSATYTNAQSKAFNLTSTNGGNATLYAVWTTPAVGDIVYEDGLIARTAVANKKPIGVIYATAANSYSVVYIGQSASASWQSGTGTNYCNGLTVNHQIWTVPTKAQLDTIYANKTKLNNALQLIIDNYTADELGVTPSSIGQSWSQTEAGSSVNYFLDTGGVYSQYTGGPTYPTRALTTYTKYAVGDIVYSDGTFASGIISGKTPIGVVYGISGGTYKVVYAGVLGPDQWKPGRLTTSCSSLTVGSKSWTIPTKDELAAMFNSLSAVNKSLQKIIDNYTASSLGYTPALIANSWSSTANNENVQWYLDASSGLTTMYNNGPSCPARAVTTY